ncbi:MAG TPA: glycosyltransferase family 4 protein [Solirubrobacterales bacterium]
MAEPRSLRILGLVEGDPDTALSGVARHLLGALDRPFDVVDRLDFGMLGAQRAAIAAATFRPSRTSWRARFHTSRLSHRVLSRNLRRRAAGISAEFDLALQVHGWVSGQPRPYAIYVDQTRLMAETGWPAWMPFSAGERDKLLNLERSMYAEAAHLFVMGKPARDSLRADYGVDESRISVVGGGLPYDDPPTPGQLTDEPSILFIGRDFERKGGRVLLEAFDQVRKRMPSATLSIVGAARDFGVPGVTGYGKVGDRQELGNLFRRARAFCLPSLYEPYGLVLIEAMAHGIPCVGSAVQSIPEILDQGGAGLVVPPGDVTELAAALISLLTDDELAGSLAANGPRWVEETLTWDHVAARIAAALKRVGSTAPQRNRP